MPRDTLTRDQIVAAAIELLDADGIGGLTMRRLGQRLGSAATAVYWHVQSKENLLTLAADKVWDSITTPDLAAVGWRDAITSLARDAYQAAARHRWLTPAMASHYVYGPGLARWQDACYAALEVAGFSGPELDMSMGTIGVLVIGTSVVGASRSAMRARAEAEGDEAGGQMTQLLQQGAEIAARFPRLRERAAEQSGARPADPEGASLDFGLQAVLDGFEARLSGRPGTAIITDRMIG